MFKSLEGLPPNVMAIEATGKVTHDDYQNTLVPKAESMLSKGPIRMLYVIGKEFTGFELEALWDDSVFGTGRKGQFRSSQHPAAHVEDVRDHTLNPTWQ
jgi:SpoIIAA-like